jgi:hypothetical protein
MSTSEPTIQEVVDTGMSVERIRDVVNGIAKGLRARHGRQILDEHSMSLIRIADALDYLVALDRAKR